MNCPFEGQSNLTVNSIICSLQEQLVSTVNNMQLIKTNQMRSTVGRPVGYVRTKVFNRNILNKTLIDGGNMFGELISEEFARLLKLGVTGREKTVGTAAADGTVTILGKVSKPFKLYLEGIATPVSIQPYVVKNLAHPLNLGERFLREYDADQCYRRQGVQLKINGGSVMLESADMSLAKPSIDVRFKGVLDKFALEGRNPWSDYTEILDMRINHLPHTDDNSKYSSLPGVFYKENKKSLEWNDTATRVHNMCTTELKPRHTTVLAVRIGKHTQQTNNKLATNNDVVLFPKKTQQWLNKNQIFVHPGVYHRKGNVCQIFVTNFKEQTVTIPANCHVGNVKEIITHKSPTVSTLDHRPFKELTSKEIQERRSYIIQQLELENHEILAKQPEMKEEIIQIFLKGWSAISVDETDFGRTNAMKFQIQLEPGAKPVRDRVRPLNPMQEADLHRQIDEWLEAGVIEPSNSAWTSALVPCKKKGTDKFRWAIDYRKLNQLTVKDAYPLSSIETNLHKLSGTVYFSTLDSAGAFHTIPVQMEHRDFTAFGTPFGQYRFCRLPFGLANAPSAYSRLVQMALDQLPPGFAMGYIDDIIIHSTSLRDHVDHLRQVVQLHVKMGMKLNLRKCKIIRKEVEYLGHLVSKDSIRMVPSYVDRILDWPLPQSGKQLRSFLGFTGYYRSFIKEYGFLTAEMNKLKTQTQVEWTDETKRKFEKLKYCFKQSPVRGYPQYQNPEPFVLDTDFSSTNMAAVLNQKQNGKEVFLGCVAKKCNQAETNYPPHKGELAAVILGLKKFEHILRAKPFIIRTDSKCVEYVNTMKEYRGIYARWNCFLSSFKFTLVHRAGKLNQNADPLSRREGLPEESEEIDSKEYLHDVDDIYAIDEPVPAITTETLARLTAQDPTLQRLLPYIKDNQKPSKEDRKSMGSIGMSYVNIFECLTVQDGIIKYHTPSVNNQPSVELTCLPVQLYNLAFDMCHSHQASGHYGMKITFDKMKDRFYFPNMYAFISAKINNCIPCIAKRKTFKSGTHNMHREELSYFGQRVYCDIVGPLSPSKHHGKMCTNLLTIQDGFTRYLVAVPIPDQQTKTLVDAIIHHWIYVFGCMEVLHTDRGAAYTSNLFKEVMRALGVLKTVTPPYSPEGDRVERAHRVLGDILRSDHRFEEGSWTGKLPATLLAYNAAVNRMTGVSPFEAVFFRKVNLPVDLIFPFHQPEGTSWSNHVENLKLKLSKMCEKITNHQSTVIARENNKIQARTEMEFKEGDTCYYFLARSLPGLSKKLHSNWVGPFVIKRIISDSLVVIYPSGSWCKTPREIPTIVNRLRKVTIELPTVPVEGLDQIDLEELAQEQDIGAEIVTFSKPADLTQNELPPNPMFAGDEDTEQDGLEGSLEPQVSQEAESEIIGNGNIGINLGEGPLPEIGPELVQPEAEIEVAVQQPTTDPLSPDPVVEDRGQRPRRTHFERARAKILGFTLGKLV